MLTPSPPQAGLAAKNVHPIHPSFRVLALATPPERTTPWLTNEVRP